MKLDSGRRLVISPSFLLAFLCILKLPKEASKVTAIVVTLKPFYTLVYLPERKASSTRHAGLL
jgi:hypothetical protein